MGRLFFTFVLKIFLKYTQRFIEFEISQILAKNCWEGSIQGILCHAEKISGNFSVVAKVHLKNLITLSHYDNVLQN